MFFTLLCTLWIQSLIWGYSTSWPRRFDDFKELIFYGGAALFILISLFLQAGRKSFLVNRRLTLCAGAYFIWGVINWAFQKQASYESILALSRIFLWFGLTVVLSQLDYSHLKIILGGILLSASAIALCVVFDPTRRFLLSSLDSPDFVWIYPIGHISYYADFMASSALASIFFMMGPKKVFSKYAALFVFILLSYALWQSATKSSLLGFMVALLWILFFAMRLKGIKVVILLIAGFFSLFLILHFTAPTTLRNQQTATYRLSKTVERAVNGDLFDFNKDRWIPYRLTARLIQEKPLQGWGVGTFRFIYPHVAKGVDVTTETWFMHPHNELLNQAMELGLVGLFLFVSYYFLLVLGAVKFLWGKKGKEDEKIFVLLGLSGVIFSLVSWQFNTNYLFPLSRLVIAIMVALVLKSSAADSAFIWKWSGAKRMGVIGLTLIAAGFLMAYSGSLFYLHKLDYKKALVLAPKAFDPLYSFTVMEHQMGSAESKVLVKKLYDQFPFVPLVIYERALLADEEGDLNLAHDLARQALEIDPHFDEARTLIEKL